MFRDRDGWRVQWREPDGRRQSKKFSCPKAARKFELELELGTADKTPSERLCPTFAEFAATWLETVCKTEKAKSQHVKDEETIRLHLGPALGRFKLTALKQAHLMALKADLAQKKARLGLRDGSSMEGSKTLSKKTANNVLALAKRILTVAVDLGHLQENPFRKVKLYKLPQQDFSYWTRDEFEQFVARASALDPDFVRLVTVAVNTGLRLGELAALRRRDLDFERRAIRVRGSYSVSLQEVTPTKGKEVADVPMNRAALEALTPWRFTTDLEAFVFSRALFWSARHRLGRLAKKAKVTPIRFHDLRHTFASWLAMEGVSLLKIQKLLRHKSPQMTLRYAHLSHENLAGVTDVLCLPGTQPARSEGEGGKSGGPRGT